MILQVGDLFMLERITLAFGHKQRGIDDGWMVNKGMVRCHLLLPVIMSRALVYCELTRPTAK
jgi:hypothetical protein